MSTPRLTFSLTITALLAACAQAPTMPSGTVESSLVSTALDGLNLRLAAAGKPYRIAKAEYVTLAGTGEFGATVFAKDVGNKQLDFHFAPELTLVPGALVYAVDTTEGAASGGLTNADTEPALDRAMATWAGVDCAPLRMYKNGGAAGFDLGIVQALVTGGAAGSFAYVGEVVHAGWLASAFFDAISPDGEGGSYILGVTFTLIWTDENGNPVDTNGDRRGDAAIREIYYNNGFAWTNEAVGPFTPYVDVETIALHEAGHALSQAHFGKIFNDGYGTRTPGFQPNHLHFSPRAVMNAIYWDTQRAPLGTDRASHCSNWSGWN